jgi:hypothetical protein
MACAGGGAFYRIILYAVLSSVILAPLSYVLFEVILS